MLKCDRCNKIALDVCIYISCCVIVPPYSDAVWSLCQECELRVRDFIDLGIEETEK